MSSSQRKLGSIVLWRQKKAAAADASKIKLDPSVRWDDGTGWSGFQVIQPGSIPSELLRSISTFPEQAYPILRQLQALLRCVMLHLNWLE